ncbi:LamG-like jellyroll fold domain-containing protein [Plantactinospora sonchi]|uniref:LamG-like jellyroll fold domain-containing protein n=1 Tax=Plantactinospora sonchi TaxID=1544735 RepID=A0ABU7S0X5_9ACTN
MTWSTPPNSQHPHVATVTTDPVVPGDPATALTWNYSYDNDLLNRVCPPGESVDCATYDYGWTSQHASTVLNTGPYSFWRLNEATGASTAASSVLSNDGTDNGTYREVTLGGAGPLAGSTSTAASFNGTSSMVQLPAKTVTESSYQSVSMWFRTSTPTGVLFGYHKDPVTSGATTSNNYVPALYVGSDGKLYGQFWSGSAAAAMSSPEVVTDGEWHHVTLVGHGGGQRLYLDGVQVGTLTGAVLQHSANAPLNSLGTGFLGGNWPGQPHTGATAAYFNGSIADVAFYNKALTGESVDAMIRSGAAGSAVLSKITSEAGRVQAEIGYDSVTGRVKQVTDENGGVWKVGVPTASGSSQVYVSTVLGSQPSEYWRLGDIGAPADAVQVVRSGNEAAYHNVSFDTTQPNTTSPFADTYGAVFNGTSSYVKPYDPDNSVFPGTNYPVYQEPMSVELWFKTPVNHNASGVLYGYQAQPVGSAAAVTSSRVPALYVGADGYLRGGFWSASGTGVPTSTTKVNDGNWHHVVLSSSGTRQMLYLDNKLIGTLGAIVVDASVHSYIGAGTTRGWPSVSGDTSYFKGNIAEVAFYEREVPATEVDAHFKASKSALHPGATPTLTPVVTVEVTDPDNKVSKQIFDIVNGGRLVAATDALGRTTSYGYDIGGFESIVFDPLGMKTVSGRDVRGNIIRSTVCRDQVWCDSTYYGYWPDSSTANPPPDPRNDQLTSIRDARSQSATDNEFLTRLEYDTLGNRTKMTPPAVSGYTGDRSVLLTYTTATTPAVGGGTTPVGLPYTVTSGEGGRQTTEYSAAGDVVRITDAAGLVTEFGHDGLGRTVRQTVKAGGTLGDLTTTYAYDADGQVVEQVDPPVLNSVTGALHTPTTTTVYDPDGNATYRKVEDTTGGDAYRDARGFFNDRGQVVKTVDAAGRITLFEYDVYGNQVRSTNCAVDPGESATCPDDERLRIVDDTYDAVGQHLTTTVTGEDGTSTETISRAYYANGNLASETDAMQWTTRYEYDLNDNVTKVTRTDGVNTYVEEENSYDAVGNLGMQRRNNGANWTVYEHDQAGRLFRTIEQPYDLERVTNFTYDDDDRLIATRRSSGQLQTPLENTSRTYDPMGRITSESISVSSSAGPVGWWEMGESAASSQASDSSPSQQLLVSWEGAIARAEGAASLNKTTFYESLQPMLVTTQSYSVSAWVKLKDLNSSQVVVGAGGNSSIAFCLAYDDSLDKWAFIGGTADSSSAQAVGPTSSTAVAANTWVHLAGVFNSGDKSMTLYVNGVQRGTATHSTPWNGMMPLGVGGISVGSSDLHKLNGLVDNVQVYQEALTAEEVSSLHGGGNGRTAHTVATGKKLTTSYQVDKRGLVTSVTDPMRNVTNYEYDAAGRLVTTTSPAVSVESFGGSGPVSSVAVARTGYNTFGEPTETQDPLTNTVTTRYDAIGRPVETILPEYTPPGGTPITGARTKTAYDQLGQVVSTIDPLDKETRYEYDSLGNRVTVIDPAGKETKAAYNAVGDLVETVGPTGAKQTATWDFLGRPSTTSEVVRQPVPMTNTTSYDYGTGAYGEDNPAAGPWLRKVTSPDGVTQQATYNWVGEMVSTTDGAGNTTNLEYDGLGRTVKTIRPDRTKETVSYDGVSRPTRVQNLDAADQVLTTESFGYNDNGDLTSVRDARNTTTVFSYDALGRMTSQIQPTSASTAIGTSFGYDAAGNRTRFTDGRGNAFWTTYNAWGLPESQIEPATPSYPNLADRTFTTSYDTAGRPETFSMPGGVSIRSEYDDLSRLTRQIGTGAEVATADRSFGYDDAGRITSLSVPSGTNELTYDDRGLPLTVTGPNDASSFTYTKDGRMASRTDAAGTTSYTYDSAGRFKTASNPTTGINLSVGYNTMSLAATITYGASNVRSFTYDGLQRLKTDTLKTAAGATVGSIAYGYDPNGNETSKVTTGFAGASSNTYTYDLANRLQTWQRGSTSTTYVYDDSGNRVQNGAKTFTYDARNQLMAQNGSTSYTYTARGTLKQTTSGSVSYTTSADAFGQVISQQADGGATSYEYDALGRAVRPGASYSGLGNTLAKDSTAVYTRGPGGELLGTGTGTGTGASSRYAWTDQHLDVVAQFTATGTTLAASKAYDPLGTVLADAAMAGSLGYQSEWTDATSGRVNMLTRWYNTDTGQFDTRDSATVSPVPDSIAANRFQYGDGGPLTTIDPTGHWGWSSLKSSFTSAVRSTVSVVSKAASVATKVVSKAVSGAAKVVSKAKKAYSVVKESTTRWVKKKVNTVKDAYNSAKNCLKSGVGKCVKETAKKTVKKAVDSVKSTVEAIKQDPWKFAVSAAVAIAATVAVGALCATGIGCLIVAGAVAGAMAAGAGYMVDVGQGDEQFSWSGLAGTMIEGGLDGAFSAGLSKLAGGALRAGGAGVARLPGVGGKAPGRTPGSAGGPAARSADGGGGSGSAAGPARAPQGDRRSSGESCDSAGRPHSFDPGTRVLMADGSTRPIEAVRPGDEVAATDPVTGDTQAKQVTHLHVNQDQELTDVTVQDGEGNTAVLETTAHHPFWDATDERWVDAAKLQPGDRLFVHDDKRLEGDGTGAGSGGGGPGAEVTVTRVVNFDGDKTMRDLTVADIHTYYVIAGDEPVLVHNVTTPVRCPRTGKLKPDAGTHGQMAPSGSGNQRHHMPQDASTGTAISYSRGPAIRMLEDDHQALWSTGRHETGIAFLQMQRNLVNNGEIDKAFMNEVHDITSRFPGVYNNRIADLIGTLPSHPEYQALRRRPSSVHVQMTLW